MRPGGGGRQRGHGCGYGEAGGRRALIEAVQREKDGAGSPDPGTRWRLARSISWRAGWQISRYRKLCRKFALTTIFTKTTDTSSF
jgi:hypothetical protein